MRLSTNYRNWSLDQINAIASGATLQIRRSGTGVPTDPDAALGGTLLWQKVLPSTPFNAGSAGQMTLAAALSGASEAGFGTLAADYWVLVFTGTTRRWLGSVGWNQGTPQAGEMQLQQENANITAGNTVTVSSITVTMPAVG